MGTIAEKLNYLNTTKTNIKNAIIEKGVSVSDNDTFRSYASKIADIEPTLGTKTITANGTYTASDDSLQGYSSVTVDIDDTDLYRDTTDSTYESVKTLSNCGAFPMLSLTAEINAVQDLHGYVKPWIGGANINKFPNALSGTQTVNGITVVSDGKGTYTISGTAEANAEITFDLVSEFTFPISVTQGGEGVMYLGNDFAPGEAFKVCFYYGDTEVNYFTFIDYNRVSNYYSNNLGGHTINKIKFVAYSGTSINGKCSLMCVNNSSTTEPFSPYSNICPITGWDEVNVNVSGINVWDEEWELGEYNTNTGANYPNNDRIRTKNFVPVLPSTTYYLKCSNVGQLLGYDINNNYIGTISHTSNATFTTQNNCHYIKFSPNTAYGTTYNNDISINYPSTDTEYHAYSGQTYNTALSTTCYGGSKDIKGNERFTHGHIASYNGETLPGAWISDRDEYAEGTTPTIGAEVVYELATPTTATSDAIGLTLAEGVNNLWANSGDVGDARYFKKVEL